MEAKLKEAVQSAVPELTEDQVSAIVSAVIPIIENGGEDMEEAPSDYEMGDSEMEDLTKEQQSKLFE